jgi:IS6 family transposase
VYWAVDQHGQVIDVFVSRRSNVAAATKFFELMLAGRERPTDVTTDLAAPLLRVVDDLLLEVLHDTTQYANSRIECEPWTASTACGRCEVCERIALRRR